MVLNTHLPKIVPQVKKTLSTFTLGLFQTVFQYSPSTEPRKETFSSTGNYIKQSRNLS